MYNKEKQRELFKNFPLEKMRVVGQYYSAGIEFFPDEENQDTVRVVQTRLSNGFIFNRKELVKRAKGLFPDKKIKPVRFHLDISVITPEWVKEKMKEHNLNNNDIVSQTTIDKTTLSLYFSKKRGMTRSVRALFFYYFLALDLKAQSLNHSIN